MSLSYRVTFLCNGCSKLIIHQKVLYDTFFIKKLVKWCIGYFLSVKFILRSYTRLFCKVVFSPDKFRLFFLWQIIKYIVIENII